MADHPSFIERPAALIVPDGFRFAAIPLVAAALAQYSLGWVVSVPLLLLALGVILFFRNPTRVIPPGEDRVVAPADGRIIEVGEIETLEGEKALRIAIFLSVFNVHINRAPLAGRVVAVDRKAGAYLAAFRSKAEHENARCAVTLENEAGQRFQVIQIVGWVARRIVCHLQVGDQVGRGARYGLIRFGSRTDLVLPLDSSPRVKVGERVRGGSSVIAEVRSLP